MEREDRRRDQVDCFAQDVARASEELAGLATSGSPIVGYVIGHAGLPLPNSFEFKEKLQAMAEILVRNIFKLA